MENAVGAARVVQIAAASRHAAAHELVGVGDAASVRGFVDLGLLQTDLRVQDRVVLFRTTTGEGGENEGEQQVHDLPLEDDTRHGALHCTARCGLLLGFE